MRGGLHCAKRGAYFFVLDAFIAGIIIVSSLAIFFSTLVVSDNPSQNYVLAEDFISMLDTTIVRSYGGLSVYAMQEQGLNIDPSITLLELIVQLNTSVLSDPSAGNLTALLREISRLAPENNGVEYLLDDVSLYSEVPAQSMEDSRLRLSSRRIVMLRMDADIVPHIFEVRLWR